MADSRKRLRQARFHSVFVFMPDTIQYDAVVRNVGQSLFMAVGGHGPLLSLPRAIASQPFRPMQLEPGAQWLR